MRSAVLGVTLQMAPTPRAGQAKGGAYMHLLLFPDLSEGAGSEAELQLAPIWDVLYKGGN